MLGYSSFVHWGGGGGFFHVTMTYHCDFAFFFFFWAFFTFCHCKIVQIHLVYFLFILKALRSPGFFSKKPWFLLLENVRKKDLDMTCALCYSSVVSSRAVASVFHVSFLPSGCTDSQFQSIWQTEAKWIIPNRKQGKRPCFPVRLAGYIQRYWEWGENYRYTVKGTEIEHPRQKELTRGNVIIACGHESVFIIVFSTAFLFFFNFSS